MNSTYNLSERALEIIKAAAENYHANGSKDFADFEQFNLSDSELLSACEELESNALALIEYDEGGKMYLYVNYEGTTFAEGTASTFDIQW